MVKKGLAGEFLFETPEKTPTGSVLYGEHLKLTDKSHMADFAGYLMPLWFTSISEEHNTVRKTAGLFDCTHMGVLEIKGKDAHDFLNAVTTNDIDKLKTSAAQYSYILDAAGNVLDDIIVYQRAEDKFMVVVNAANEPKIKAYLEALENSEVIIDADKPERKLECIPEIRDMRDCSSPDCRVDIALQGPASMNLLMTMIKDKKTKTLLENLKPFHFIEANLRDFDCIISRTGYTGAKIGYELFVHPEKTVALWVALLQNGKSFGAKPCGLGARDSLRIEAGLPLYGHELAGQFNISPFEAGYGWAVKLDKKFFIGKSAIQEKTKNYDMQVARIELAGEKGIRPVRQNDGVLDEGGNCIGWVLSCAKAAEKQVALIFISKEKTKENERVGIYHLARSQSQITKGKKSNVEKGDKLEADITGMTVSRFAKF